MVTEPAQLRFVDVAPVYAEALGHAGDHELHHRAVERPTCGRHLLDDVMTVSALTEHALDGSDLTLEPAHAGAQRADVLFREREAAGAGFSRCHDVIILPGVPLCILPGVCYKEA